MAEIDARRELVDRVLRSATFERSRAARAFLSYVCERALGGDPTPPSEVEIAAGVLAGEETGGAAGGVVRAQASQVRKKLQQYFATEGSNERAVLELPLGSYLPVFRDREVGDQRPPAPPRLARAGPWLAAIGCAALLAAVWLVARSPQRRGAPAPSRPAVERLWRQMFDNGRPTTVLLADVNVAQVQDLLGHPIPLADYNRNRLNAHIEERIADRETRVRAVHTMDRRHTTMADVTLAGRALLLHTALGLTAELILARDAAPRHFEQHNVILSGPRRANPWLELFEPRLNFKSRFDETTKRSSFENTAPAPGEQAAYTVQWTQRGFCRVAYLPGRDGHGTALLISGTDLTSTEVGADFMTNETWVQQLLSRLGAGTAGKVPHFEVLLGTNVLLSRTSSPELIAHRVISTP